LAWLRLLALDGALAKAEPKTLRYRTLHAAARLTRGGRRRRLRVQASWPWAADIVAAWDRISALPQPPSPAPNPPCPPRTTAHPRARAPPGPPARQPGRRYPQNPQTRPINGQPDLASPRRRRDESSRLVVPVSMTWPVTGTGICLGVLPGCGEGVLRRAGDRP